jgi:diguanylate cyclase (GGDEF)-like protein
MSQDLALRAARAEASDTPAEVRARRRRRTEHLPWIAASCAVDATVIGLYSGVGAVPGWVPLAFAACCALLIAVSYTLLLTGFSERFRDPYISGYQMTVASLCMVAFAALAPRAAPHCYNVMLVIFTFGALRMNLRQALVAGGALGIGIGAPMVLHLGTDPGPLQAGAAAVDWLGQLTVLARCVMVGLYGSQLRGKLRKQNEQLAASTARIEQLATHDELTGALNRRALWALLEGYVTPPRSACGRLCLALIDLDHFKQVNDRFGHPVGDAVLKRFAEVARGVLREGDRFGRYGGEEFLVLLPNVEPEVAQRVVERIRQAVESVDWASLHPGLAVTASAGLAAWTEGETVDPLLARADAALYRAKAEGRNRVVLA